jgi:PAS domain S-box-containing protein
MSDHAPTTPTRDAGASALDASAMLRAIPTPAVIHRGGIVEASNRAAQKLFGFADEASMKGFNLFGRLTEEAMTAFAARRRVEFASCLTGEEASWEYFDLSAQDGTLVSVAIACSQIQHGGDVAVLSFFGNHTPSLALDYALRYSREVAVSVTDLQGKLVWSNPANTALTGYAPDELLGKTPGEVLQCEGTDPHEVARLGRHIRAASSVSAELLNRHKSGREYWVRVEILPSRSPDGALLGFVGMQTDITAQVTKRQQRERQRDEALATFSHEARAPLNAVLNLLDLLLDAPLSPPHARLLRHAIEASETLKDLVTHVLDNSRLEHLDTQTPLRPLRMQDLLRQVEVLAQGYRRADAVSLRLECPPDVPAVLVRADLLLRTLLNLVSNALKYTPKGSVTVRVEHDAKASGSDHHVLRFSVTDTGIGIAEEDQRRILKPFETVASAETQGVESTGLGLNLCERMLGAMGSSLRLYSAPGAGTMASFELNCLSAQEQTVQAAQAEDVRLDGLSLMVVDDNPLNLLVTRLQLERRGAQVRVFEDVMAALEALFEAGPKHFHVVLMDLQMPTLDGADAVRRIHLRPGFEKLPVVALSGEIDPGAIEAALAAGMVDFVQKPFDVATLVAKLSVFRPLGTES